MTSVPTPSPAITAIVKVFIGSNTIVAGRISDDLGRGGKRVRTLPGDLAAVELVRMTPDDGVRFFGDTDFQGGRAEGEEKIMMEVVGLAAGGGDTVDIGAGRDRDKPASRWLRSPR